MAHRIQFNEAKLLEAYERMMDEVYLMYHVHPTNIKPMDLTAAEIAEMDMYDAMGRSLAGSSSGSGAHHSRQNLGHGNGDFCNGMPRRSR